MHRFNITPAGESDVPAILEMILELAEFEHLAHEVQTDAGSLRAALFGGQPVAYALVGRVGDAVAGYAIYYRTFSTFVGRPGIYLEDLYVRPQFRKCGLGRAMLEAVARASIDLGGGRLEWAALNWNENALRFYRGLGARVMDDWLLLRMTGGEVQRLVDGGG
jgi:GNAT superfamily N-acetyltransferase